MECQKVCKQGRDDIIVKVNLQSPIPTSFYITVANLCENDIGMRLCKLQTHAHRHMQNSSAAAIHAQTVVCLGLESQSLPQVGSSLRSRKTVGTQAIVSEPHQSTNSAQN